MEYKLNFPVETKEAQRFWASKHRLNRIKAIIAFSLNLDNANDNLRRAGYASIFRHKMINLYKCYVNQPKMDLIPFSELTEEWFDPIPCTSSIVTPVNPDDKLHLALMNDGANATEQFTDLKNGVQTLKMKLADFVTATFMLVDDNMINMGSVNPDVDFEGAVIDNIVFPTIGGYTLELTAKAIGNAVFNLTTTDGKHKLTLNVEVS